MWFNETVIEQIYPLGFCGAEPTNEGGEPRPRLRHVLDFVPHWQKLGVKTLLFNPLFESDAHGYDTRDMRVLDRRLGTNEDLADVCRTLRGAGFHILFDGVFNHVGRGFWAFKDVQEKRQDSPYKDWFYLNFEGNSAWNDGFYYEGWEGHYGLVKLNLGHWAVRDYIFQSIRFWKEQFGISGLRLDVAYCLDPDFLKALHAFCLELDPDFFLLGEMIHGDYKRIVNSEMCHSATNYECAKGLLSAFNSRNLFEIAHSLQRQFNDEPWALYHGNNSLLSFVDNHDVNRAASVLRDRRHLPLVYSLMLAMPGIPALYYGSEWGLQGERTKETDRPLRPYLERPEWNGLTDFLARAITARSREKVLAYGSYRTVLLTNEQFIFERAIAGERILIAINMAEQPYWAHFDAGAGRAVDLLSGQPHDFGGGSELPPLSTCWWKIEA